MRAAAALYAGLILLAGCEAIGRPPVRSPEVSDKHYGFRATFPAGSQICDASSSLSALRGYHQTFEADPPRCDSIREETVPGMGLTATGGLGLPPEQLRRDLCPVEVPAGERAPDVESLMIGSRTSTACQGRNTDGTYTVWVATLGEMELAPGPEGSRRSEVVIYRAGLNTDRNRIARDLPIFRAFLATIEIGPREWRGDADALVAQTPAG